MIIYFFLSYTLNHFPSLDVHLGYNRPFKFGLSFGRMEIQATARNANGQSYLTTLEIVTEDMEDSTEDTESD